MKLRLIIGLLLIILLLSGCRAWGNAYDQAGSASFKVISIKGPSAVGFIKAMEPGVKPLVRLGDTVQYTFEEDEDDLYTRLLAGEFDIAVVPTEMAAKLYNNGAGYQLAAVNTSGYLYLLAKDETITHIFDLKGKVVKIAGENTAADVIVRYLLLQNDIDPSKDVNLEYTASAEALVKDAMNGKIDFLVLSEPWVSDLLLKDIGFNIALDIQDEWKQVNDTAKPLPLTCLIVKNAVISEQAEAWNLFLEDYSDSINWVNSHPDKTAELIENHAVGIPKELAEDVISRSNLEYLDALSSQTAVEKYLTLFLEVSPEAIGGKLPNTDFYYEK